MANPASMGLPTPYRALESGPWPGGLLGLLGGPAGALALAAAGAVVGGMAGKADGVIPEAGVELLAAKMRPASSALLFLVEETHIDALTAALAEYQAEVVTIALGDEISNEIHHATALPGQVAKQTESGELLEAQPLPGQVRHQLHTK
jgi:uncharacterized membrane protein